jgi:hypothetical protein
MIAATAAPTRANTNKSASHQTMRSLNAANAALAAIQLEPLQNRPESTLDVLRAHRMRSNPARSY